MASKFTTDNYTHALQNLMPTGIAWPRDKASVQYKLLYALAQTFQKSDERSQALLSGAFPATALDLLIEWEETLGLPDECSVSEQDSIEVRRNAIISKLTGAGGQSRAYFIRLFEALGYTITITEYRQARAGWSVAGEPINGEYWPFVWKVTAPDSTYVQAKAGHSYAGDPLRSGGNKALDCTLKKVSPSHTVYMLEFVEASKMP